jgi:hypothetical protein
MVKIGGTFYEVCTEFFNNLEYFLYKKIWIYDRNLDLIGYKIVKNNIVDIYDMAGKLLEIKLDDTF